MMSNTSCSGEDCNGWLIIDKPSGITSADVVRHIKSVLGKVKIGHTGTLDPMATGVLPIALGMATKMIPFLSDTSKAYEFTVKWGEDTDTYDADGRVMASGSARPSVQEIEAVLPFFTGRIMQSPPAFSAIKINGQKAYDLARVGNTVEIEPREITIQKLEMVSAPVSDFSDSSNYTSFKVECSQGTYVRSLAHDMASKLGVYGHIVRLRRTKSGKFTDKDAILLEKLEQMEHLTPRSEILLPPDTVLNDISVLALTEVEARTLVAGNSIPALPVVKRNGGRVDFAPVFRMTYNGRLLVLARLKGASFHPQRVLVNSIEIGDDDVDYTKS